MSISQDLVLTARALREARAGAALLAALPKQVRSLGEAYAIQDAITASQAAVSGWKVGRLPPDGVMFSAPLYEDAQVKRDVSISALRRPMIEVELAFVLTGVVEPSCERQDLLANLAFTPLFEIIESRFEDMFAQPMFDLVADSTGSRFFSVGEVVRNWRELPASALTLTVSSEDERLHLASFARELAAAAELAIDFCRGLDGRSKTLFEGMAITTGSIIKPVPLKPSRLTADFGPLGAHELTATP